MKFTSTHTLPAKSTDALVVFFADLSLYPTIASFALPILKDHQFDGSEDTVFVIHTHGKIMAKSVIIVGVDGKKSMTVHRFIQLMARIGRTVKELKAHSATIIIPTMASTFSFSYETVSQSVVLGIMLSTYSFLVHKNTTDQKKEHYIEQMTIVGPKAHSGEIEKGMVAGGHITDAVYLSRDLVNEPSSVVTPTYLATIAKKIAKVDGRVTCTVFGKKEMKKMGMNALLGIAQGSVEEPKFIHLSYTVPKAKKTICLVGKGLTFDSGGLSLKSGDGMETMKIDMAGASTILGIFSIISALHIPVNVVGLIGATENMPSGSAIKPGDVVTAMNGKTIEILNTDAEGRVVLADVLSYASRVVKPDVIIDLATLTGACMVALGEEVAGLFSSSIPLAEQLKTSAEHSGELLWELPLVTEYLPLIKSKVADVRNIAGTRYGGSITAALFLQSFVPDTISWAHMDIAGPAFAEKDAPLTPYGGTGYGVRMLIQYLVYSI